MAVANSKQVASYLRTTLQAFKKKSKELSKALLVTSTALADHVAIVNEKTALADNAKSKQENKLSSLHTELKSHRLESRKIVFNMITFYNWFQMRSAKSEKWRI